MTHHYLPMTEEDRKEMLAAIGVTTVDELFEDIPESVRFKREYKLKKRASEACLTRELYALSAQNASTKQYSSFLGAGVYDHYIPSVVDHIISRSEFYTAYTPYQPEISQGELQAIFEFQTMICELTGMDVANSSMYDGGTALAEAAMVSAGHTKKRKILVSSAVHPESREVLKTYAKGQNLTVVEIPHEDGLTSLRALEEEMDENVGSVILQYPNFFGQVEPLKEIEKVAHKQNALFVVSSNPLSLGVLAPPGEFGADIVVGDAQPFGIPMQFGGPHCGYFATSKKLMRKIPGRLVGQTKDNDRNRGFVLTLQAREQHIRRDKATSNICSNQALNALAASVAMTSLGKSGVKEMAKQNMSKAHYAKKAFEEAGFDVWFSNAFFNEFVVSFDCSIQKLNASLLKKGIIGGYDLGRDDNSLQGCMLIAVTEIRSKDEIDKFVEEVRGFHHEN